MTIEYIRSDSRDGQLTLGGNSSIATYLAVHDYTASSSVSHNSDGDVGQQYPYASIYYLLSRLVLFFDTSGIPAGATIESATLTFKAGTYNYSSADFYIEVVDGNDCQNPLVTTDYGVLKDKTTVGGDHVYTNPWVSGTDKVITLNATGLSWINPGGLTKLALRSLEDINISQPTTLERVGVVTGNNATESNRPLLTVTWAATPASVTTQACTNIGSATATGNGNITNLGAPAATQHGHCWNTGGTPTTADDKTELGVPGATGAYTSDITGLSGNTTYYVRAYVIQNGNTYYGNEVSFTTGSLFPSDPIVRVTGLVHRYDRREKMYTLEAILGDVTTDFGIPEWASMPESGVGTGGTDTTGDTGLTSTPVTDPEPLTVEPSPDIPIYTPPDWIEPGPEDGATSHTWDIIEGANDWTQAWAATIRTKIIDLRKRGNTEGLAVHTRVVLLNEANRLEQLLRDRGFK